MKVENTTVHSTACRLRACEPTVTSTGKRVVCMLRARALPYATQDITLPTEYHIRVITFGRSKCYHTGVVYWGTYGNRRERLFQMTCAIKQDNTKPCKVPGTAVAATGYERVGTSQYFSLKSGFLLNRTAVKCMYFSWS